MARRCSLHRLLPVLLLVALGSGTARAGEPDDRQRRCLTMIAYAETRMRITGKVTSLFLVGGSLGGMTVPFLIGQVFVPIGPIVMVWAVLASGHLASFDRSKCTGKLNGPTATGQHCPEGWMLYPSPGPQLKGVSLSGSADSHYYDWVDQFDTLGLGKNVPIVTGNGSDSLMALVNGKFVVLRVPYPLGFFAKGMDGRFDDAKAGWKGKGVWTTWGTRTAFHSETGKGTNSKVVHFQMRPDPLAN